MVHQLQYHNGVLALHARDSFLLLMDLFAVTVVPAAQVAQSSSLEQYFPVRRQQEPEWLLSQQLPGQKAADQY
jgi:hypothetical protein